MNRSHGCSRGGYFVAALVLASSLTAAPPTTNLALATLVGKSVVIRFDLDLNEDGLPTPLETQYLAEMLRSAGARVRTDADVTAKDNLVIIGRIAPPRKLVAEDAASPIAKAQADEQRERFAKYHEILAEEKAKAAKVSVKATPPGWRRKNKPPRPSRPITGVSFSRFKTEIGLCQRWNDAL